MAPDAAFYCVADERYFLGAVGVLNSLRLVGQGEPLFILDCGLRDDQRRMLAAHASVVPAPARPQKAPWLLKTAAPLAHPADVTVLIDADMLVTRSLDPLLERAAEGRIVAFENDHQRDVPDWGKLLGLGPQRPGPYVSSGFVAFGGEVGERALRLLDERQRRVEIGETIFGGAGADSPFAYPEQDVLNAILRTRVDPADLLAEPHRLAPTPPFAGLRLVDRDRLRCSYADGSEPYLLHHFHRKPWLTPIYHGLYSRLLSRVLLGPGIELRVPEQEVPLRMRDGAHARLARARSDVVDVFRRRILGRTVI